MMQNSKREIIYKIQKNKKTTKSTLVNSNIGLVFLV